LLLEDLWDELLEIKLEATEEEMRAHYDAHPEMYKIPEEIVIQEIMVADRERAKALLEEIRNGADMADLATQHSLRRFSEENGGLYAMRAFEKLIYKEIMAVALNAPDLELQGPVELQNPMPATMREPQTMTVAYSIFKVLQRLPERVQTFELSREKAQYFARQAKQQSQLRDLNLQLRRKYRDKWGINQEALTAYARALATP
jgi:parvulin-like peptidyl-prolyl isomerase